MQKVKSMFSTCTRVPGMLLIVTLLGAATSAYADDDDDKDLRISGVEISGNIEIEASFNDGFDGENSSDLTVSTVDLGVSARLNKWVAADVVFLFEEDDTEEVTVDEAYVTLGNLEASPLYLRVGRQYVPFGSYESFLVSDTLPNELGEAQETALVVGAESGGAYGELYAFNGDVDEIGKDDQINNFGLSLGYAMEDDSFTMALGVDYISNLADSDEISEKFENGIIDKVGGLAAHAIFSASSFTLIAEYLTALDNFEKADMAFAGSGAEPKAWQVEAAYEFSLSGMPSAFALSYQATDEAVGLGLPETRISAGLGVEVYNNTVVSLEWAHDKDYDKADGGTDETANAVTLQLAVGF